MPKYTLFIDIKPRVHSQSDHGVSLNLYLVVKERKKIVGEIELPIERNLDSQLMDGLDKIFKRNRLNKLDLKSVEISQNIDQNSTYYRIILAFKKGLLSIK